MAHETPLPPLRRKIRRSYFALIGLYALLGVFMLASVFFASGTTPKMIHLNYDSIAAAMQMRQAWTALYNPTLHPEKPAADWAAQFERAAAFAGKNITEPGEGEIVGQIRDLWSLARAAPGKVDGTVYAKMSRALEGLVAVNEKGMFRLAEESSALGHRVFVVSLLFLLITFGFALLLADGLASRLARPIKEIAEVLRTEPSLDRKLKLPRPTSLEMRILTSEIGELWARLATFQKLNVEELAAERERLETVLASVEDGMLVLDTEGRVRQVSDGMLRILSLPSAEVIGRQWSDLSTAGENYLRLRERLRGEIEADNVVELVVDAAKRTYAARSREISTPAQPKVGMLYLLHDITESRHRDRLKAEFIGVLSHELKTPLQSLGTAAELLAKRAPGMDDETKMLVETVNEDVARIRAVASDFMQVGAVDLHSLKLKLERVAVSELIQEWIKPFRLLARDKNVRLEFLREGEELIWANVDVVKLPWAISNLLANAIRVSSSGTAVTVFISNRGNVPGMAEIEIRDEGPGIPDQVQARMFEPYYQAPASSAGASSGFLGLGLTIAREVVEAHEGKIDYFPRRPHGSVFRILIPYAAV